MSAASGLERAETYASGLRMGRRGCTAGPCWGRYGAGAGTSGKVRGRAAHGTTGEVQGGSETDGEVRETSGTDGAVRDGVAHGKRVEVRGGSRTGGDVRGGAVHGTGG